MFSGSDILVVVLLKKTAPQITPLVISAEAIFSFRNRQKICWSNHAKTIYR
jgi:hypothetical protein